MLQNAPRRRCARLSGGGGDTAEELATTDHTISAVATSLSATKEGDSGSTTPFRFLDLPPEIRNSIYAFAFKGCTYNLARFQDPGIAIVSRQTRTESLPILYSDANWMITVGINLFEPSQWRNAGNLGLRFGTKKVIHLVGDAAVFRDVTIRVVPHSQACAIRPSPVLSERQEKDLLATLSITTHPKLECGGEFGSMYAAVSLLPDGGCRYGFLKQVRYTIKAAQTQAKELCSKDDFKGLTLEDLDKIAKAFRLIPPESTSRW